MPPEENKMKFAGMLKQSLVDYPGKIAAVLFTRGCNLRCPYCHNSHLLVKPGHLDDDSLQLHDVLDILAERAGFLDAVVISGGEPTLNDGLFDACKEFKALGYLVKLDTNGTRPLLLEKLVAGRVVDYVAMDIKAPLECHHYLKASGRIGPEDFLNIRTSVHLLRKAEIDVEFRTTVVPGLHHEEDIVAVARSLEGARLYSLQQFNPRHTLDTNMREVKPYSREELFHMAELCRPYVKNVRVCNLA